MRFVIWRIGVLAIPAHGEVDLSPDSTWAFLTARKLIVTGCDAIEVEAEECDGLLGVAACIVCSEEGVACRGCG